MWVYAIAFLGFIGSIYHLVTGLYYIAICLAGVAIFLAAAQFFWDAMEGHPVSRVIMAISAVFLFAVFEYLSTIVLDSIEIGSAHYVTVAEIKHDFPEMNKPIGDAIEDSMISLYEYSNIQEKYRVQRKVKAIKYLRQ